MVRPTTLIAPGAGALPRPDDQTLSRYLLCIADAINEQINRGLTTADAPARLRECATIAARVAQQIDARANAEDWSAGTEADAVAAAEAVFATAESRRAAIGIGPAPETARRLDRTALEKYLQGHASGGPGLAIEEARLLPGGRCKLTALVCQSGSARLPKSFVLRQDWQGGATDTSVTTEYALLERVSSAGVRAPRPLLLETNSAALGQPFILLELMPGGLAGSLFTPPRSRVLGLQLAAQIGRLHALPAAQFAELLPASALSADTLSREVNAFREMQASIGIRSRVIDASVDWLAEHIGDAGTATSLTHNDLGFHNCLVQGETLTAILDWELAAIGNPAADLGYIKPFVDLMLPWDDFLDTYHAAGGLRVSPETLRFHTIWNAVRLYGLIMRARAAIASGLVNDVEIAFACADNLMLLIRALAGELRAAGAC